MASLDRDHGGKKRGCLGRLWLPLGAILLILLGLAWFGAGSPPAVEIQPERAAIGRSTPVAIHVAEPDGGLSHVRVELVQGDRTLEVAERTWEPRPFWNPWGERTPEDTLTVEVGSESLDGLEEGEATLRVTADAAGTWIRRPEPTVEELTLPVMLRPPRVGLLSTQHNVRQGGSGAVVYRLDGAARRDGVEAGERFFPGYDLPGGGPGERFALYAAPYDLADGSKIALVAEDAAGNVARLSFVDRFTPKPYATDTIRLSDGFLEEVVPEILANTPSLEDQGDPLASYLQINGELRRRNRARLVELSEESLPEFLWSETFLQMPNAQVMSPFAAKRTYLYDGEPVDTQFHLGYDLATVRRDEIPAANDGLVVVAEYFGIYGNCVILDHGFGLMSLYGHLSSLDVAEEDRVRRGQSLGRSGQTGLAGGDHLHFGILLGGLPVDPLEWWDGRWIRDHVDQKLGEALPFGP